MPTTYLGKPCKWGHGKEEGKQARYTSNCQCTECHAIYRASDAYKDYQAAYHQNQRKNDNEKLLEYRQTQIAKGNCWQKYYNKEQSE